MNRGKRKSYDIFKSISDFLIASLCLALLLPIIAILALTIKLTDKGPVIYSQKRIGKYGRPFMIYKFRSMKSDQDDEMSLISGREDKRITSLGRFMRKHKFDEIPNLVNVLKGEMSVVGPRPEQPYYIDQIVEREPLYKQLQLIKPGITSWGQVKYGYATNVDEMLERLKFDLYYLNNRSLRFDMKIAFYTLAIIFRGLGI
jgi:lipopolysaccharide/colanic/teichoic acid biosynthesis glycosyltransferase